MVSAKGLVETRQMGAIRENEMANGNGKTQKGSASVRVAGVVGNGLIQCRRCGAANSRRDDRKYCGECGEGLWETCKDCGGTVSADERFCGHCGVDLETQVERQAAALESRLRDAQRLELDYQYEEAIGILAVVVKTGHSRLRELSERARALVKHLYAKRDGWRERAREALASSRDAVARFDYGAAVEALESIPGPVRSDEARQLLVQSRAYLEEVRSLDVEVKRALEKRCLERCSGKLDRLLELQPEHALGREAVAWLGKQLRRKAEEKIAAHRYEEALGLLEKTPRAGRGEPWEAWRDRVGELCALYWDLTHAPYVDSCLVEVASRLGSLAGEDRRVAKLCGQLKRRVPLAKEAGRGSPVGWASAPAKTLLGCPIERPRGWGSLVLSENLEGNAWTAYPGRFAVACGLALQGLGRGPVGLDFRQAEAGFWSRVGRLRGARQRAGVAWGIEIGSDAIKVVKLAGGDGRGPVEVRACDVISHRRSLSRVGNAGEARDVVAESFAKYRQQHAPRDEPMCFGLPGRITLCRDIRLPRMDAKHVADAIRYEVRRYVPGDADSLVWRHHSEEPGVGDGGKGTQQHLVVAIRRAMMEQEEETFERLQVSPALLQSEYLALHNYHAYQSWWDEKGKPETVAGGDRVRVMLEMGSSGTNMVFSGARTVRARYLGVGGQAFTEALGKEFQLTGAQTERLKRNPTRGPSWRRYEAALAPVLATLSRQIEAALDAYRRDDPGARIERIVTLGGGFQLHGLLRYLRVGR